MTPSFGWPPSGRGGKFSEATTPGFRRGARATALEGSTMIFMRSQTRRAVEIISSSVTSRMRSTWRRKMAKVRGEREAQAVGNGVAGVLGLQRSGGERPVSVIGAGGLAADDSNVLSNALGA